MTTDSPEPAERPALGTGSLKYLEGLAADSFKRQAENDESIWRSMPFFMTGVAVAVAVVGSIAQALPPLEWDVLPAATYLSFSLSMAAFGWALTKMCVVLRPRDYEFPAKDSEVRAYAEQLVAYHLERGVAQDGVDAAVERDLRDFMFEQYASAAETNLTHNAERLGARGHVLLYMLTGFVLALTCALLIFVMRTIDGIAPLPENSNGNEAESTQSTGAQGGREVASEAVSSEGAIDGERGIVQPLKAPVDQEKMMSDKPPPPPPPPRKPDPPAPQTLKKNEGSKPGPRH